jgi:uncharacterized pyridoxal phosphate-containing UPF0001 family protein
MKLAKQTAVEKFGLKPAEVELSMGMTGDFESAIMNGSNMIRIGTKIFGERPPLVQKGN